MQGILKFVGGKFWSWPQDHISEIRRMGVSVRIAPNSIPDLQHPYPIFFAHPRGTFVLKGKLVDLFDEMQREGHIPADHQFEGYVEESLPKLAFIGIFRSLEKFEPDEFARIVEKYDIKFRYALTHYSYVTGNQVVIGANGEGFDVVEQIEGAGLPVEPVRVVRKEESNE